MIISNSSGAENVSLINHQGKIITFFEKLQPSEHDKLQPSGQKKSLYFTVTDVVSDASPTDPVELTYPDEVRTAGMSLLTLPEDAVPEDLEAPGQWQVLSDGAYYAVISFAINWWAQNAPQAFMLSHKKIENRDIWVGQFLFSTGITGERYLTTLPSQKELKAREWYFVSLEMDMNRQSVSIYWRSLRSDDFEYGTFEQKTQFRGRKLNDITVGKNRSFYRYHDTRGTNQRIAELSVWDRKLSEADRERLFWAPPIRDAAGLQYSWNVPPGFNGTTQRSIENAALYGPAIPFDYESDTKLVKGPKPTRKLFAGAGPRFAEAKVPLAPNAWSHIAVSCGDNNALAFDGSQVAVAKDSKSLSFGEQLSIDGRFQFGGLPEGETTSMILAKSDNADNVDNMDRDASYQLSCDDGGTVTFTVFLDDQRSYSYKAEKIKLPKDKPAYLAVSASVVKEEPEKFEFKYKTDNGSGEATSENKFTTKLVMRAFIRTDEKIVRPKAYEIPLYKGSKSKSYEIRRSQAQVTLAAIAAEPSPKDPDAKRSYFKGVMGGVRLWSFDISKHFLALSESEDVPEELADGLEANWRMGEGKGAITKDVTAGHDAELPSSYMWTKARLTSDFSFYVNDQPIVSQLVPQSEVSGSYGDDKQLTLGAMRNDKALEQSFHGQMDDIRLWSTARSAQEVADNLHTELSGGESGLAAYWPVDIGSGVLLKSRTGKGNVLKLSDPDFWWRPEGRDESPIGNETPQVDNALQGPKTAWHVEDARSGTAWVEYGALYVDSQGVTQGVQYRGYAYLAEDPDEPDKKTWSGLFRDSKWEKKRRFPFSMRHWYDIRRQR